MANWNNNYASENTYDLYYRTRSDPIQLSSDNEGTHENPLIISDSPSYHPTQENWGQEVSSGYYPSSQDIGASNFSNWTCNTPEQYKKNNNEAGPSRPRLARKTARMSVRPSTETFRMPSPEVMRDINQEVDHEIEDEEGGTPSPYRVPPAPAYVQRANPNIHHDMTNSQLHPPPQYGYSSRYPQSMHEHIDRLNQENGSLRNENEGLRNQQRRVGGRLMNIAGYIQNWGKRINEIGEELRE